MNKPYPPVAELLPHRPPMILIDEILEITDTAVRARVVLTDQSPFVEDGAVSSLVSIEYMAQSIAAFAGASRRQRGEPVIRGYLIACREMTMVVDALAVGDELEVVATQIWHDEKLGNFDCSVTRRGETVARAWLSVYQGDLEI